MPTMPQNASSMLGMNLKSSVTLHRAHHGIILAGGAGVYHPDPSKLAFNAVRSGFQGLGGSTIFGAGDGALILSATMTPDMFATNPGIQIRRLSDGAIMEEITAHQNIVGAHRGFPFFCEGGFDVNLTALGTFSLTWVRLSGIGV